MGAPVKMNVGSESVFLQFDIPDETYTVNVEELTRTVAPCFGRTQHAISGKEGIIARGLELQGK